MTLRYGTDIHVLSDFLRAVMMPSARAELFCAQQFFSPPDQQHSWRDKGILVYFILGGETFIHWIMIFAARPRR